MRGSHDGPGHDPDVDGDGGILERKKMSTLKVEHMRPCKVHGTDAVPVVRLEAVRDAIEKMVGIIPHQHCRTCNQFAEELQSLFYILKEPS